MHDVLALAAAFDAVAAWFAATVRAGDDAALTWWRDGVGHHAGHLPGYRSAGLAVRIAPRLSTAMTWRGGQRAGQHVGHHADHSGAASMRSPASRTCERNGGSLHGGSGQRSQRSVETAADRKRRDRRIRAAAMYFFSARLFAQNILLWSAAASAGGARTWRPPGRSPGRSRWQRAGRHLAAGHGVAVPQFLSRPDFPAELENAASDARSPAEAPVDKKVRTAPGAEQQQRCRSGALQAVPL